MEDTGTTTIWMMRETYWLSLEDCAGSERTKGREEVVEYLFLLKQVQFKDIFSITVLDDRTVLSTTSYPYMQAPVISLSLKVRFMSALNFYCSSIAKWTSICGP